MDLESFTKNFTQYLSNGPFNTLFTNPIYVALLITIIVVLIVVCMFNESKLIKTSFYIMCTTIFIIFIHNKLLLIEHRKQLCNFDTVNICNTIGSGPSMSGGNNLSGGLEYLEI
jgi:hypothetical protein